MKRRGLGILGATGLVGQRLIRRLVDHPWFETVAVGASSRSAGRSYASAVDWIASDDPPPAVRELRVLECRPEQFAGCDLVLSALDTPVAREVEPAFVRAGFAVASNSSAFRQAPDVPLVIAEINADHLRLIDVQRRQGGRGFLVTNPNCSAIGLALALAPLHRAFGVRRAVVTTLQAISGAGVSGPRAHLLVDNVIPHIPGEEEKLERELAKLFGTIESDAVRPDPIRISAHCHRVAVQDGHLGAVSVELERPADPAEAERVIGAFRGDLESLELPSGRFPPLAVRSESDRPQPRLDRETGEGMTVVIGRVRTCPVLGLKLEFLSHNAVRGAAGGTLLLAELLAAKGLLPGGPAS